MISIRHSLKQKRSKNRTTIRTSVSFHGQRIVFCPGYSICPDCWDFKTGFPKSIRGNSELSSTTTQLKELECKIRKVYEELSEYGRHRISTDLLSTKIYQMVRPDKFGEQGNKKLGLIDFVDVFISDSVNGVRLKDGQYQLEESTIKPYRTARKHLIEFEKYRKRKLLVIDLNQNLHDEFSAYLTDVFSMSKNSHSKYLMLLSQILKYAITKKLLPNSILNEIKFRTGREETDSIYLNEQELELIMNLDEFSNKGEEIVRDIFVLGCYTGLRFSNYSQLNLDYINDGKLVIIQKKTKQKVTIPIHPYVKNIIDKYGGILPEVPTNQEFNRTLKDIGRRIPELDVPFAKQITRHRKKVVEESRKWEKICTHTARRSFCTNMYLMGVPVMTIMAISGHKTEKSFRTYIKAAPEEHARIMEGIWKNQITKDTTHTPS